MNRLRDRLRDADPLACEPPLDRAEVEGIRQHVLSAAGERHSSMPAPWLAWAAAVAGGLALGTLAVGDPGGERRGAGDDRPERAVRTPAPTRAGTPTAGAAALREMHFTTAGGTRLIWLFGSHAEEER